MYKQSIPRFGRVIALVSSTVPLVGTVVWFDRLYGAYIVDFGGQYQTIYEQDLVFTGELLDEKSFLGTAAQISFDTQGPGRGRHAEGCLRRCGTFWECFFVRSVEWKEGTPWLPRVRTGIWQSGIVGHLVEVEEGFDCVHTDVADVLAELLDVSGFVTVVGPDSCSLK